MESAGPLDFSGDNSFAPHSSDTTRELARKQGAEIPPETDSTHRYFQPRFVTQDPPSGALVCLYGQIQAKETAGGGPSFKALEADAFGSARKAIQPRSDEQSEETRLVKASDAYDTQVGQYKPQSSLVPIKGPYYRRHRGGNATAHRGRAMDAQYYHEPSSSATSTALTSYHGGAQSKEDESHHASREISNKIAMLSTLLGHSSGTPDDNTVLPTKLLTEISDLVMSAICNLRFERDNAQREVDNVLDKGRRDSSTFRADNRRLQEEVKRTLNRERMAKKELDMANAHIDAIRHELEATEKEALNFRDHHVQIKNEMKKSEESQRLHVQSLEGEIKRLRARNAQLAKATGQEPESDSLLRPEFSPPSAPRSHKANIPSESTEANHEFLWGMLKKKCEEQEDKQSKQGMKPGKKHSVGKFADSPESALGPVVERKISSSFNPEAPSFQPPLSAKNLATASDIDLAKSPVGGPSNWPTLLPHGKEPAPGMGRSDLQPATVIHAPLAGDGKNQSDGTVSRSKSTWDIKDVDNMVKRITQLTKGYIVRCHKPGLPTKVSHKVIARREGGTWRFLTGLVFTSNMFQAESNITKLLEIEEYRPYLIMRIVLDYLFRQVISPSIFLGFSSKLDEQLRVLQNRISQFSRPDYACNARERQAVLDDHAKLIGEALKSPGMDTFRANNVNRHTQLLSNILNPLREWEVSEKDANAGVRTLVTLGWEMSTKVWTSGLQLVYYFPKCSVPFVESAMTAVNLDAFEQSEQSDLQLLRARVSFVISPSLSVRDDRNGMDNGMYGLKKAEIIAM